MLQERENTNTEFEIVKKFFVDPANPKSAEDLALLGANAVRAMAQIYATGGVIDNMSTDIREWLKNPKNAGSALDQQVGEILQRESKTRRFDQRFVGQIHPQGNKIGIIGNLVAAYMNTNRIFSGVSKSEAFMEQASVRWMAQMFGYDSQKSGGNLTAGGTDANIQALWIAREKALAKIGKKITDNTTPMYVFVSKEKHYSIDKACQMLGINMVLIKSNNFKIDLNDLEINLNKTENSKGLIVAIIGIAGETETGLVEDIQGLADISKKHNIHYHVDAAYGGPFVLSRAAKCFKGINEADSITIDPHKMLYTPYPAGAIILKNKDDHFAISSVHTVNYLRNVVPRVLGSMTSAGVISTWGTIKLFGAEGIAALLNHTLDLADFAYQRSQKSKVLKPMYKPELNTLLLKMSEEFKTECEAMGLSAEQISEKIMGDKEKGLISMEDDIYNRMGPKDSYVAINSCTDHDTKRNFIFPVFRLLGTHPYTTNMDIDDAIQFLEKALKERITN